MNLNQLYYFRCIAKLQHFRLAAQELNISQPSLSHSMSNLEEELGTSLFEKQGRNVILTKYGKLFLEYVEESLNTLELGQEKVMRLTSSNNGNIDVAYVFPLAPSYIPKTARNFLDMECNSEITFTFGQGVTSEIIDGLKSSKYDLGFCSYVEDEPDIFFEPILKQELLVIAHPDHPLSKLDSIELKDIEAYPLIGYDRYSGLGKLISSMFKDMGISPNIAFEGEDENAISGLVAENFGVAVVAKTSQLNNFNVTQIPITNLIYNRYIYLAYVKNRYLTPAIIKFIDFVKKSKFSI